MRIIINVLSLFVDLAFLTDSVNGSEVYTLKPVVNPAQKQPASWLKESDRSSFKGFRGCSDISESNNVDFHVDHKLYYCQVGKVEPGIFCLAAKY